MFLFYCQVACKQLGYQAGHTEVGRQGSGIIWLDEVVCSSINVARLVDCNRLEWGKNDCTHDEDISILCYSNSTGKSVHILMRAHLLEKLSFLDLILCPSN